jgi:hypothetical protein
MPTSGDGDARSPRLRKLTEHSADLAAPVLEDKLVCRDRGTRWSRLPHEEDRGEHERDSRRGSPRAPVLPSRRSIRRTRTSIGVSVIGTSSPGSLSRPLSGTLSADGRPGPHLICPLDQHGLKRSSCAGNFLRRTTRGYRQRSGSARRWLPWAFYSLCFDRCTLAYFAGGSWLEWSRSTRDGSKATDDLTRH